MRGDMQPELHHGGLQNDSSSGSSSPHSNTSHEDILEVSAPDLLPKGIYNFSIPEVIKHEPRIDRGGARNDPVHEGTRRKRNRSINSLNADAHHRTDIVETPVIVQTKKRRKGRAAAAAAAAAVADMIDQHDDGDDNCHRQNVPVIDLTDTDSHDEYSNAHSDSELNMATEDSLPSYLRRTFQSSHDRDSLSHDLSNLQRYQQHLQARNRIDRLYMRNPSLQRLHRYRRRNEALRSRQIITDGPLVTEDMLIPSTPEPIDIRTPTSTSASLDDSILVVNEVRGNQAEDDYAVALRMQNDPSYSPSYLSRGYGYCRRQTNPIFQRIHALRQHHRHFDTSGRLTNVRLHLNRNENEIGNDSAEDPTTERESHARDRQHRDRREDEHVREDQPEREFDNDETENPTRGRTETSENPNPNSRSNANSDDDDGEVEFIGITNPPHAQRPTLRSLGRNTSHLQFSLANSRLMPPMTTGHFSDFSTTDLPNLGPLATYRLHHDNYFALFNFTERINPVSNEDYEEFLNIADRIGPAKPRGLEKSDIERIPSFRFSSSTAKETNTKCVVCISEYTNREKLRRLPCSHDFHAKCIDKWLKSNKTCPVCRNEVNPSSTC